MNSRVIVFAALSSFILMSAIILQNVFNPAPPAGADNDSAAEVASLEADNGSEPGVDYATTQTELAPESNSDADDDSSSSQSDEDQTDDLSAKSEELKDGQAAADDLATTAAVDSPEANDEFVTFGSLAADSGHRYLITANHKGGTIRRVELNVRYERNGRFRYRDLEYEGGYLGCLDCLDTPEGCLVRAVGHGTPAYEAKSHSASGGLQVGDILVSLNDEPVTSAKDFEAQLAKKTKPRTEATIGLKRDGTSLKYTVQLTDKPIELLKDTETEFDPEFDYPESFVLSLLKPQQFVDQIWPDLDAGMRNGRWELKSEDPGKAGEVAFQFSLTPEQLKQHDLNGPISVVKRYRLPELGDGDIVELDSHTFHFDLDVEIHNESEQSLTVAYELDGPTGTPTETWWYANKIHGRSTAIGYTAGARDILGSTADEHFQFLGGPEIVKGAIKTPPKIYYISNPLDSDPASRELNYVGVDTQYFYVSLLPETDEGQPFTVNSVTAFTNGGEIPEKDARLQKLVDVTFQMVKTVELDAGSSYQQTFTIFSGPKEPETLDQYGLDDARTFGWFAWCSKPLMWLLHFFYFITGSFSYGLAIIMLTVLVRCLMIPISRKAALNAQMMQHLQPQIKEIADKYQDNMEKRAAAQRELFKRYSYNPLSGCFMMFFQLPIFIGLYRGLSVDIALRDKPLIPGMSWCSNLSGPDQFLYWENWMPAFLSAETGWLGPYLNILPLATMCLFIVQQKLFMPPATDDQQKMMQKMMTFMMIFMGVMFFKVAAGLCLYFITSSLWGIIERKLLPKPELKTDKLPAAGDIDVDSTPKKKISKSAQKAELKRESELAERKRRNAERAKRLKKRGV